MTLPGKGDGFGLYGTVYTIYSIFLFPPLSKTVWVQVWKLVARKLLIDECQFYMLKMKQTLRYFEVLLYSRNNLNICNNMVQNVLSCIYFTKYVCNGIGPNLWNSQSNLLKGIFIDKSMLCTYIFIFLKICEG